MAMKFWAVEVKSGETLPVELGGDDDEIVLHLSQANLGEMKDEGNESVCIYVHIDGKKLVLGTLYPEKLPQQQLDLVFDRKFELSHNWKNGSVFFYGYKAEPEYESYDEDDDESDEEKPVALNNGKPYKAPVAETLEQKVKIVEPNKDSKPKEDEDSSDESDESMSEDDSESGEEDEDEESNEESGDSSEDEDEETPKKVAPSKKRPAESATKTPVADKKAKVTTPQKNDGKKGGHVSTPYPSKPGKTPANKPGQQTPKSGGSHACKSCNRSFGSEQALDSHTKAKHK